jgi:hypothetical protein
MILKHRFLLTCGLAILSVVVALGSASAQSSTRSSAAKKHHAIQVRHPLYNSYNAPVAPVAPLVPVEHPRDFRSLGCYLPSDGCPGEYSVQN